MLGKEKLINKKLLFWYDLHKRDLPWRKIDKNGLPYPYYVFVSEYMLQQTTVNTVKNKFNEFIEKWPNIEKLSLESEGNILKFWSGLGYYSRARNLLKAAKIIKNIHQSKVPNNYDELIKLPGIGDYTAKAILGIAFNKPTMPTDANIERIIVRLFAIKIPIVKVKNKLKTMANKFISKKSSSNLIQSFMDYGSSICIPRKPKCDLCKIANFCESYKKNLHTILPLKIKKISKKPVKYSRAYVLINEKDEILVRNRPPKGMLASMLEVPNDKWVENKNLLSHDKIFKKIKKNLKHKGSIEYTFSHFHLETDIYFGNIKKSKLSEATWIKKSNYNNSGLPTVMKKIVEVAI